MMTPNRSVAEQQELLCYLRKHYEYEPKNGALRNLQQGTIQKGSSIKNNKYLALKVWWKGKNHSVAMHRAIWGVYYGQWPKFVIDHIDGDCKNNHIENLRDCPQSENLLNMEHKWKPNPITGVPGVVYHQRMFYNKMQGKQLLFSSPYEAFFIGILCGKSYKSD